jgi:hypothetical protein
MERPTETYRRVLSELYSKLASAGEHHWTKVLHQWITELELMEGVQTPLSGYAKHLARTKGSFGGMGSLNDIAIVNRIPGGVQKQNMRVRKLISDLYDETMRLLNEIDP